MTFSTIRRRDQKVHTTVKTVSITRVPTMPKPLPMYRGKHAIDFAMAAGLFILSIPLMLLAMALVRISSPGPALYSQRRLGRSGRPFTIYKIRTMRTDAETQSGPKWSTPGDPRITPMGRFLRATHLDELPQLWNVLCGEMSLVGPRPERPEIATTLRTLIHGYDLRLAVKPGITGYAQVHLPPDESIDSVRKKLTHDVLYIRHRSFALDAMILVWTGLKVLGLKKLYRRTDAESESVSPNATTRSAA